MYTPEQSLYIKGTAGDPLPKVWEVLDRKNTRFLRGQLALICAGPGTGKSAFVLTYALRARVPTFYFSADSDPFTQLSRMVSILTEMDMGESARRVRAGDLGDAAPLLRGIPIRFSYNASPSFSDIKLSLESYEEVYGDFPALVIIDNVTNVRTDLNGEDPFSGLEVVMEEFHELARITGACVVCLHHVTGGYNDANKPIPLSGVKGQITRIPELVLTLHKPSDFPGNTLGVSTVKNRAGRMDPSGQAFVELEFIGDTMQIRDVR